MERRRRESRAARHRRVMRNRIIALAVLVAIIVVIIVIIASCSKKNAESSANGNAAVSANVSENGETSDGGADSNSDSSKDSTADGSENNDAETKEEGAESGNADASSIKNEKPIQLYTIDYTTMTCTKVNEVTKPWTPAEDIDAFGAFCSTENSFTFVNETRSQKETWDSVKTDTDYKIGYELSFDLDGDHKVITILKPGDIESNPDLFNGDYPDNGDYSGITGYMGVWVYDDLHQQEGAFYTHIKQNQVNDNTLLTSIKLRPTPQSDQISNLVLKGFSYSSDKEFDKDGHYIGNYAATVTINRS